MSVSVGQHAPLSESGLGGYTLEVDCPGAGGGGGAAAAGAGWLE